MKILKGIVIYLWLLFTSVVNLLIGAGIGAVFVYYFLSYTAPEQMTVINRQMATIIQRSRGLDKWPTVNKVIDPSQYYNGPDEEAKTLISKMRLSDSKRVNIAFPHGTSAEFKAAAYSILKKYATVIPLKFYEVEDLTRADIVFNELSEHEYKKVGGITSGGLTSIGLGFISIELKKSKYYDEGSWTYSAMLHEVGHALGLKHPGQYYAKEVGPFLEEDLDNNENTVMSYYNVLPDGRNQSNLGPLDIRALQILYGANPDFKVKPRNLVRRDTSSARIEDLSENWKLQ